MRTTLAQTAVEAATYGTGVPLVTPFDGAGRIDHDRLPTIADWLETNGIDFLVPRGSTGKFRC